MIIINQKYISTYFGIVGPLVDDMRFGALRVGCVRTLVAHALAVSSSDNCVGVMDAIAISNAVCSMY